MILHDYFRSSAAYRVRIALNVKGLQADRRYVHLRRGEQRAAPYLAVNPQGLLPALEVGGGRTLTQSLAIVEYLEERHPDPPLLPPGAEDRARVRAIALAIARDIHPHNNLRVLQYSARAERRGGKRDDWYRHWIRLGFERSSRSSCTGASDRFCFGEAPTLADVPPGSRSPTRSASRCRSRPIRASPRSTTPASPCPPSPTRRGPARRRWSDSNSSNSRCYVANRKLESDPINQPRCALKKASVLPTSFAAASS